MIYETRAKSCINEVNVDSVPRMFTNNLAAFVNEPIWWIIQAYSLHTHDATFASMITVDIIQTGAVTTHSLMLSVHYSRCYEILLKGVWF